MLYICKGQSRKRLTLSCCRFYSAQELFKISREQGKNTLLWLEYGPNLYQVIMTDSELRFACCLVEGDIDSTFTDEDRKLHIDQVADMAHTDACEMSVSRGARKRNNRPKDTERKRTLYKLADNPVVAADHGGTDSDDAEAHTDKSPTLRDDSNASSAKPRLSTRDVTHPLSCVK